MFIYKRVIGWGLGGIRLKDGLIDDIRINSKSPLLPQNQQDVDQQAFIHQFYEKVLDTKNLSTYMPEQMNYILDKGSKQELSLTDAVTYDTRLPNFLLLTPLHLTTTWIREKDPIDLVRDYLSDEPGYESRCELLPDAPPPYSNKFYNKQNNKLVDGKLAHKWRRVWLAQRNLMLENVDECCIEEEQQIEDYQSELEMISCVMGFSSADEAEANLKLRIPLEVRSIARFGKLFSHDDVFEQLQPYLYTLQYDTEKTAQELNHAWKNAM